MGHADRVTLLFATSAAAAGAGRISALADWWAAVTAPQATLLAALGVGLVGGVTILQKLGNDRRDQWWKRSQWAIDLTLQADERSQIVGWAAIRELSRGAQATRQDRLLFRQVVDAALDEPAGAERGGDRDEQVAAAAASRSTRSGRSRAQAARTRVELDQALGLETPAHVAALAQDAPLGQGPAA